MSAPPLIPTADHTAAERPDGRCEFSVCQFFPDGSYDYIKRFVSAQEAVETARDYTLRPAAKIGVIQKIIITDGGDCTNFVWEFGKGVTYPPKAPAKAGA